MRKQLLITLCLAIWLVGGLPAQQKAPPSERPCVFTILLPAAAHLEIEGYPTKARGEVRLFESPPVPVGKSYVYTVRAIFGGIVVTRTIEVSPDKPAELDLRPDFGIRVPAPVEPKPKPKLPEKAEPIPKETQPPSSKPPAKPPVEKPQPLPVASFTLQGLRDLVLPAGGMATVRLTVERKNLDGVIDLRFTDLPKGLSVSQSTIPAGASSVDLTFRAAPDIPHGKYQLTLYAGAAVLQQKHRFTVTVVEEITVKPIVPAKPKPDTPPTQTESAKPPTSSSQQSEPGVTHPMGFLRIVGPNLVTLRPGQSTKLLFCVERHNLAGPVHFQWIAVPAHVTAPLAALEATADQVVLTLNVAPDAAPITYDCRLQASTAGGAIRVDIPVRLEIR